MDDALASNPLARSPRVLQIGGYELDLARGELRSPDGQPAELRRQALDVLLLLGTQAGHFSP